MTFFPIICEVVVTVAQAGEVAIPVAQADEEVDAA